MLSLIRMLLIGAVLYLAGHLAMPGPAEAAPDLASTWVGETGAEPASAIVGDPWGSTPLEAAPIGNDTSTAPDVALCAEFFPSRPPSMSAGIVPAPPPPTQLPAAPKVAAVSLSAPTQPAFRPQHNHHLPRLLEQYPTASPPHG